MTDLLKRLDYVYKKSNRLPGRHPDVQTQLAFIDSYEKLKDGKGKDDPIYFMDGVHHQHNSVAAYGWIKQGTDKSLESNTGRARVNSSDYGNTSASRCCTTNAMSTLPTSRLLVATSLSISKAAERLCVRS